MLERHDDDGIAVVRLARPPVNALDVELCEAVLDTFGELAADGSRAVVLTGSGSSFSAGLDLRRIVAGDTGYIRRLLPVLDAAFEAVFKLAKPVVAAINGHAIAGGCILAAACDRRLMTTARSVIGVPELLVGVPFPTAALEIVRAAYGTAEVRRLTLDGELLQPAAALERGVVDELVDPDELVTRAIAVADRLGGGAVPAATFATHKAQLHADAFDRILRQRPHDTARVLDIWCQPQTHAWIGAYLDAATGRR